MTFSTRALSLAAIAAVLLSPLAARAEGLYLSGNAGINIPRDSNLDSSTFSIHSEIDNGFAGAGAIGWDFGNGFRIEGELGYRTGGVDNVSGVNASGDVHVWTGMGNVLYDVPTDFAIKPFVGFGAGLARVSYDSVSPVATTRIDDNDTVAAVQGIAGLGYKVDENLNLDLSYRYVTTVQELNYFAANGAQIDSDYSAHTFMIGLRWSFPAPKPAMRPAAAPAPQPAPPPAPAPMVEKKMPAPAPAPEPLPRNYLVFFDWNSAAITPQARNILNTAAEAAKEGKTARIVATGHADRSGPRNYNLGLSKRRADAVKAVLVGLGIPAASIAVVAKGETEPLVPTADGVREPQNRRVEIVLQ